MSQEKRKQKTYRDNNYDDLNYKGLRDIRSILDSKEDYYEPIKINNAFNDNYIEYESNGDKDKQLSIEEYLHMIKPYWSKMINSHKTRNEWKIQLVLEISLIYSKYFKDTRTVHIKY